MIRRPSVMLLVLVIASLASTSVAAPAENGYFHFGATRFEITDALAYRADDQSTVVLLTDFTMDRDDLLKAIITAQALYGQILARQRGNYVMVTLHPPDHCGVQAFLGETVQQLGLGDEFDATITNAGTKRIKGVCSTSRPEKMFDDTYEFRLPFDLALTTIPKPTRLPADGGEPGRALIALVKAIQAADIRTAKLHLRAEEIASIPATADLQSFFDGLSLNYPKSASATGGLMKGDLANVEMKGTDREGRKIEGTFSMKKTAGNWRVVDQYLHYVD